MKAPWDATTAVLRGAVHDLKGPAGRLRLLAQLVGRDGAADAETRTLLGHIESSAAAVMTTANALARYVEMEIGAAERAPADLNAAFEQAVPRLRERIAAAGAQISAGRLPLVEADARLMAALFEELLENALRFRGPDPPRIRVAVVREPGGEWFVAVADNGCGIAPGLEERVFLPFKKMGESAGAGLGLTICRSIVESHGGRIWAAPAERGADLRFFVDGPARWESE